VPEQERQLALLIFRQEILHVHLLDHVLAIGVELGLRAAGLAHDHAHLLAFDLRDPSSDMKRAHAAQHDVVFGQGRCHSRCNGKCRGGQRRTDKKAFHRPLPALELLDQSLRPFLTSQF